LRIVRAGEIALGPGKAQLLELIGQTGSITDAAKRMRMSYMRAWTLVRTMNRQFAEPLVQARRGGTQRGGAGLTPAGRDVLALYRELESRCEEATKTPWNRLRRRLGAGPD
jgi:molybdate transport system regulatory protein